MGNFVLGRASKNFIAKRSEGKGTTKWSLSRANAGYIRLQTSLLGAGKETKPPKSGSFPRIRIPFMLQ
ncbi:MAG: hypothetical protein CVV46_15535 [Spirochaetae bacterium HGW-Spirochaetae-2]|nr:MAG: hypothetical protein CVV46_15535 [Spirochaetae bacterium HGW-Spirochaetae-2]